MKQSLFLCFVLFSMCSQLNAMEEVAILVRPSENRQKSHSVSSLDKEHFEVGNFCIPITYLPSDFFEKHDKAFLVKLIRELDELDQKELLRRDRPRWSAFPCYVEFLLKILTHYHVAQAQGEDTGESTDSLISDIMKLAKGDALYDSHFLEVASFSERSSSQACSAIKTICLLLCELEFPEIVVQKVLAAWLWSFCSIFVLKNDGTIALFEGDRRKENIEPKLRELQNYFQERQRTDVFNRAAAEVHQSFLQLALKMPVDIVVLWPIHIVKMPLCKWTDWLTATKWPDPCFHFLTEDGFQVRIGRNLVSKKVLESGHGSKDLPWYVPFSKKELLLMCRITRENEALRRLETPREKIDHYYHTHYPRELWPILEILNEEKDQWPPSTLFWLSRRSFKKITINKLLGLNPCGICQSSMTFRDASVVNVGENCKHRVHAVCREGMVEDANFKAKCPICTAKIEVECFFCFEDFNAEDDGGIIIGKNCTHRIHKNCRVRGLASFKGKCPLCTADLE